MAERTEAIGGLPHVFSLKPDYEISHRRFEAWWHGEIIDRPPVSIQLWKKGARPTPQKTYSSHRERWLDIDFRAEQMALQLENYEYLGDSLPIAWPNLGPEIFSGWCGCGYEFGQDTTWSTPCIDDWETDADKAVFNPDHPLFKACVDFTKRLLDLGRGKFIVGLTDFHPGGDHLAALRDPARLAMDMIENLDHVKAKLRQSMDEYYKVYDIFYEMLRAEGMPITTWTSAIHDGRYYLPSNDFSCMISKEMFDDVFLPGIAEECKFYDRSLYHLDGPGALRHLDSLLELDDLTGIQWICGAGNEGYERWVHVYQRIQKAGKVIQLIVSLDELPRVFETLRPEGVWFSYISGITDKDTADAVLKRIEKWA
jgi:hypothetical protein